MREAYLNPDQEVLVRIHQDRVFKEVPHAVYGTVLEVVSWKPRKAVVTSRKPVKVTRQNTVRLKIDGFKKSVLVDSQSVYNATFSK